MRELPPLSASEETLDAPTSSADTSRGPRRPVAFVEANCPGLTSETAVLLRARLRAAALSLGVAFAVFLLWRAAVTSEWDLSRSVGVHYLHALTTLVLVGAFVGLRPSCRWAQRLLPLYELAIFGLPALFFLAVQYESVHFCAYKKNYVPSPAAPWQLLIFTYALFIPHRWQRAAPAIGAMALAPVALLASMAAGHDVCAKLLAADPDFLPQVTMIMLVCGATAVFGVRTIGALRSEAFEARQLGQYKLLKPLGKGGMGEVYLAEHQMMKRPCAVKIIRPSNQNDPRAIARFEREVRATARLSHWNTIEIFDYGRTDDGTFYYVMEYLPGLALGELVDRFGPMPAARVIHLLRQTCDALGEAHAKGLVHRDIKPGNVFAAQRGGVYDVAKLLDFGLAKPVLEPMSPQLTQEGFITGSPLFMSPEQATGESTPDGRSDIYSLGAVAYFLLTGAPPFQGDNAMRVIFAHAQQAVVPPSRLRSDVPPDLEEVVLRCLAKRPDDRFADAASLEAALAACAAAGQWGREEAAQWWTALSDAAPREVVATG